MRNSRDGTDRNTSIEHAQDRVDLAAEIATHQPEQRAEAGADERGEQPDQHRVGYRLEELRENALAERRAAKDQQPAMPAP